MAQPQNRDNNSVDDDLLTATIAMAGLNVEDNPQLPMVKVDQERVDNGAQCTTCLETFNLNEDVAKLKCQHIFHRACIEPWLQRTKTCPICRHRHMDAIEELMHNNIENGKAIIDAVTARILDPAVDYGNERNRQVMEDKVAYLRGSMDRLNEMTRRVMRHHAMDNLNELNRQAMEQTGEQLRQTMDKVNELNRKRQAFSNAHQQMMLQFQEKVDAEGDPIEMALLILNLISNGISLLELYL